MWTIAGNLWNLAWRSSPTHTLGKPGDGTKTGWREIPWIFSLNAVRPEHLAPSSTKTRWKAIPATRRGRNTHCMIFVEESEKAAATGGNGKLQQLLASIPTETLEPFSAAIEMWFEVSIAAHTDGKNIYLPSSHRSGPPGNCTCVLPQWGPLLLKGLRTPSNI